MRFRLAVAALACLLLGAFVVVYRGPGWYFLRFTFGDVLAVAFLHFGSGVAFPGHRARRAIAVGTLAATIETLQALRGAWAGHSFLARMVLGSTFAWTDLVAYAAGLAGAVTIEHLLSGPECGRTSRSSIARNPQS